MGHINVILMHGKDTNPSQHWYPWLREKMQENNIPFTAPTLPDSHDPAVSVWLDELDKTQPNEYSILVGHSRGGVTILRWLERQPKHVKVKKVILVAASAGDSKKIDKTQNNRGFFSKEGYDFQKIKTHCDNFVIFHSKDDRVVPSGDSVTNARGLNAKLIQFEDRGHFGLKLPKPEIPELLAEIMQEA